MAEANPILGEKFSEALAYAVELHGTQARKGGQIPYIGHLLGVASLVIEDGGDEDEIIAALVHDGPEDAGGEPVLHEIGRRFGPEVERIVAACSDTFETPKPPWQARKQAYIDHLRADEIDEKVLRVSLADKVHNARAIAADYRWIGEDVWQRFRGSREGTLWYYESLLEIFKERLPSRLTTELESALKDLRQRIETSAASPAGSAIDNEPQIPSSTYRHSSDDGAMQESYDWEAIEDYERLTGIDAIDKALTYLDPFDYLKQHLKRREEQGGPEAVISDLRALIDATSPGSPAHDGGAEWLARVQGGASTEDL